jgi:hypothetical protein
VVDLTGGDDSDEELALNEYRLEESREEEELSEEDIEEDSEELLTAEHAAALQSAIATVPISRLREVCARLSLSNGVIALELAQELLGLSSETGEVMPKWAVCVHCGEEFSPRQQGDIGECSFHPGGC